MEIARIKLEKLQFRFTPGAEEKFYKQLNQIKNYDNNEHLVLNDKVIASTLLILYCMFDF